MTVEPRRNVPIDTAKIARLWNAGELITQIAATMGLHPRTVTRAAHKMGLGARKTVSDFWNDEKIAELTNHVRAGLSFGQIGSKLGCTKNAAISKANRLGLHQPEMRPKAERGPRLLKAKKPRLQHVASPSRIEFYARKEARQTFDPQVIPTTSKPWTERTFGECAAPVAGEGADTFSCCQPTKAGSRYCDGHASRFYMLSDRAPRERRRAA